jgi:hypothetical protein
MKLPKSSPDKLPAEGNSRFKKFFKSFKVLILNKTTINNQIMLMVIINMKRIDFCNEKSNINGQNKLNRVVIIYCE